MSHPPQKAKMLNLFLFTILTTSFRSCSAITYPKGNLTPEYINGAGDYKTCHKTTTVFGVHVCITKKAWATGSSVGSKLNHIVQVFYQLLDNDGDGIADAPKVVAEMIKKPRYLYIPTKGDGDRRLTSHRRLMPEKGTGQMTGIEEAFPFSCDVPRWRGASQTDRTTWLAKRSETGDASNGQKTDGENDDKDDGNRRRLTTDTCCHNNRDATVEEIHHLITNAAMDLWSDKWKGVKTSTAGQAAFAANANCGWGYLKTFKKPNGANPTCTGQYAYSDPTCEEECAVTEGLFWSSVSYMGGLFTDVRAASVANEFLMTVPDASMKAAVNSKNKNAKTLEEGSPALYGLVSDTTSEKNKWMPSIMPDGIYCVGNGGDGGNGNSNDCTNPYANVLSDGKCDCAGNKICAESMLKKTGIGNENKPAKGSGVQKTLGNEVVALLLLSLASLFSLV